MPGLRAVRPEAVLSVKKHVATAIWVALIVIGAAFTGAFLWIWWIGGTAP